MDNGQQRKNNELTYNKQGTTMEKQQQTMDNNGKLQTTNEKTNNSELWTTMQKPNNNKQWTTIENCKQQMKNKQQQTTHNAQQWTQNPKNKQQTAQTMERDRKNDGNNTKTKTISYPLFKRVGQQYAVGTTTQ